MEPQTQRLRVPVLAAKRRNTVERPNQCKEIEDPATLPPPVHPLRYPLSTFLSFQLPPPLFVAPLLNLNFFNSSVTILEAWLFWASLGWSAWFHESNSRGAFAVLSSFFPLNSLYILLDDYSDVSESNSER